MAMKRYAALVGLWTALLLTLAVAGCTTFWLGPDPNPRAPGDVYDNFWQTVDRNYANFGVRNVNWDSVYQAHRPLVSDTTSPLNLLRMMGRSIRVLRDGHVVVRDPGVATARSFTIVMGQNFPGISQIRTQYAPSLQPLSNSTNLFAGDIRPQVGYLYVGTFVDEPAFDQIDALFDRWRDYKAIVIDIRDNTGGNDANGERIASRIARQQTLYRYVQYRTGPRHSDLSDYVPSYLSPRGNRSAGAVAFTRPVYLLTNRAVFSAANGFTMMLRALPNVTQIGDVTGDGVAGSVVRELINGWNVAVPVRLTSLPDKTPVDGRGIAPQIFVLNDNSGRDRILETALALAEKL